MSDPYGVVTGMPTSSRSPRRRRMWLQGGSSTQYWDWDLVVWALAALGVGTLGAAFLPNAAPMVWLVMLVPVIVGFRRSVPRGLLRFKAVDLLVGVVAGVTLRIVSGWMEQASEPFTTWPTIDTSESLWWLSGVVAPVLVAPVVEELFFHGLLLVALYTVLRRASRSHLASGVAAALLTTALFVIAHVLMGALDDGWGATVAVALVAVAGAVTVLLTGRIWGAVVLHLAFNASYVALGLVSVVLAGDAAAGLR